MAKVAITIGDVAGVGPEIALHSIRNFNEDFVLVGPENIWNAAARHIGISIERHEIHDTGALEESLLFSGKNSATTGSASHAAVVLAGQMAMRGEVAAMVTAPISKTAWQMAGFDDPGHTELIGEIAGKRPVMGFVGTEDDGSPLRVALATIHVPLREVPALITTDELVTIVTIIREDLRRRFNFPEPRIALTGLNPHAGESGRIGTEDSIIAEACRMTSSDGPFPADALFSPRKRKQYDLIVAMYHDQGLAPFKALTSGRGVNITLGLPFIRTSPDHGTAFDIAGRGTADSGSMRSALQLALDLC